MAVNPSLVDKLRTYHKSLLMHGIFFVIFGIVALIIPGTVAEFFAILVGLLLLVSGLLQIWLSERKHWAVVTYASSIAAIVAGLLLMFWPNASLLVLAAIIGIFLFLEGCFEIALAALYAPFSGWIWMLLSGIITLALSIMIYAGWPLTGIWLLGIVIGVNFICFGLAIILISQYAKREA